MPIMSIEITPVSLMSTLNIFLLVPILYVNAARKFFFYLLSFNVSRFSRQCSEPQFKAKRKEIDVEKSVYLNLCSDKVAGLPVLHTFLGAHIKESFFSEGKKEFLVIFQRKTKLSIKHLCLVVQT